MATTTTTTTTDRLRRELLSQAYLFDDPRAYAAGVEDALAALERVAGPTRETLSA